VIEKKNIIIGNKYGQIGVVILSITLFFIFLYFLIFEFSIAMLSLLFIEVVFSIFINYSFSKYFDVAIENEIIVFKNIWRVKQYSQKDLLKIELSNTIFPYPFNPFLVLRFKNGINVYSKIKNPHKTYLSKGGINLYISNLEDQLLNNGL